MNYGNMIYNKIKDFKKLNYLKVSDSSRNSSLLGEGLNCVCVLLVCFVL